MGKLLDFSPSRRANAEVKLNKAIDYLGPALKTFGEKFLLIVTIAGVVLGIIVGISVRSLKCTGLMDPQTSSCTITPYVLFYLELPGALLVNLLRMIILPLLVTCLIGTLGRMSLRVSGKMSAITIFLFTCTTIIAIILSIVFGVIIKPGSQSDYLNGTSSDIEPTTLETIFGILRNLCPPNIVQATFQTAHTNAIRNEENVGNWTHPILRNVTRLTVEMNDGMNALGVIAYSSVFGLIITRMGSSTDALKEINDIITEVSLVMATLIGWYAPFGAFFLMLHAFVDIDSFSELRNTLGYYMLADIVPSLIHMFIVLPILTAIVIRRNPFKYYYYFLEALVTAFTTSSSGATLGVACQCAEDRAKIDKRISRFIIPLGATVHMEGTVIHLMTSAMFFAYLTSTHLNAAKVVVVGIVSLFAAVSTPGIPGGSRANMAMVLGAVGVQSNLIAIVLATDWLLDRVETTLNISVNLMTCVVLQSLMQKDLSSLQQLNSDMDKIELMSIGDHALSTLSSEDNNVCSKS